MNRRFHLEPHSPHCHRSIVICPRAFHAAQSGEKAIAVWNSARRGCEHIDQYFARLKHRCAASVSTGSEQRGIDNRLVWLSGLAPHHDSKTPAAMDGDKERLDAYSPAAGRQLRAGGWHQLGHDRHGGGHELRDRGQYGPMGAQQIADAWQSAAVVPGVGCTVGTLLSGISAFALSGWVFGSACN